MPALWEECGVPGLRLRLSPCWTRDTLCLQGALWVCLRTAMSVNIKGTARGTSGMQWVLPLSSPLLPLILQPRVWGWLFSAGGLRGQEWAHGGGEARDPKDLLDQSSPNWCFHPEKTSVARQGHKVLSLHLPALESWRFTHTLTYLSL